MSHELIPPPELAHDLPDHLTYDQRVMLWLDVLETTDQMLLAGLAATLPPGADVREAYRKWYEDYCQEHFKMLERMAEHFNRVLGRNGSNSDPQDA